MNPKLAETLRSYGGPLSAEQVALLRDMQGWIEYCIKNGYSMKSALGVVAHDVNGVLADAPFLKPRVSGYAKYLTTDENLAALADEPNPNDE